MQIVIHLSKSGEHFARKELPELRRHAPRDIRRRVDFGAKIQKLISLFTKV